MSAAPMAPEITFIVPGVPQGKGRARVGKIAGHARLFTPTKTVAYEGLIAHAALVSMRGAAPYGGPVALDVVAMMPIPGSWSKKKRAAALMGTVMPTTKPDMDNIVKAIGDGGNGVLWDDDKQIVRLTSSKVYAEKPGVFVSVWRVFLLTTPAVR